MKKQTHFKLKKELGKIISKEKNRLFTKRELRAFGEFCQKQEKLRIIDIIKEDYQLTAVLKKYLIKELK